jgi:hypothetical protein
VLLWQEPLNGDFFSLNPATFQLKTMPQKYAAASHMNYESRIVDVDDLLPKYTGRMKPSGLPQTTSAALARRSPDRAAERRSRWRPRSPYAARDDTTPPRFAAAQGSGDGASVANTAQPPTPPLSAGAPAAPSTGNEGAATAEASCDASSEGASAAPREAQLLRSDLNSADTSTPAKEADAEADADADVDADEEEEGPVAKAGAMVPADMPTERAAEDPPAEDAEDALAEDDSVQVEVQTASTRKDPAKVEPK